MSSRNPTLVARTALVSVFAVVVAVVASCSSGSPAPMEEVSTQGQAVVTGCGTPISVTATADGSSGSQSFASTALYVPSSVQAIGAMWYPNTKITATLGMGSTSCTYESFVAQVTPADLAFVSCNDSSVPGTTLLVTGVTLSGTLNAYVGYATLQASVPRSVDDFKFCTIDSCSGGNNHQQHAAGGRYTMQQRASL